MNATDRARTDRLDLDLHEATDRELEQLAHRLTRNPALCDCGREQRNDYGYPVAPRITSDADYADWRPEDREALAATQHDTREALDGFHDDDVVDWIVEEALTQIGRRLRRHGYLRVPRICDLVLSPDGRLTVHPVPGLRLRGEVVT